MLMINTQRPEPPAKGDGLHLDFHSMFYTIQGEGPFSGHPSVFVRLAGCNLQCPGCDTEYTQGRRKKAVLEIVNDVADHMLMHQPCRLVVITGGEPFRQNIGPLISHLREMLGVKVQVETNGVFGPRTPMAERWEYDPDVYLVVSPKTKAIDPRIARNAAAYKYVIQADAVEPEDGLPRVALHHRATPHVARPAHDWRKRKEGSPLPIYLSPMDEHNPEYGKRNLVAARDSCLKHGYILGVQLHKLADIE
jgi:7-carboxy-7-deazaguanine synthase